MLTDDIKHYINSSVLCWLATCDCNLIPNVSPKEIFTHQGDSTLLIANLFSPNSIENIRANPNVCVSFVNVFIQKGYKLKGTAHIFDQEDFMFKTKVKPLTDLFTDQFPIKAVIEITITKADPIIAPSYRLYPGITEADQIKNAMATYKVKPE